jgi:Signal transduction histidine kinase
MNRLKSLNQTAVLYVLYVMLFAGLVTSLFIVLLYSTGFLPFAILTPILSPLIALFASSIIGTSITALMSERVLKPLNELIRATAVVSTGDFGVRVNEIDGDSEIADLLRNFNHMAEELGGIEMFRSDFINDFSHEFKTPIVSIRGFAKQLQNESLSPEKRKEYTDIIVSESERLSSMATNILLLAKLENQQIVVDQRDYELDEQVRDCVILLEREWERKKLELDLRLEPVTIRGNADMLSQLWINLIDNAIKYSRDEGSIAIACDASLDTVRFEIADDGIGMDEDTMKHAFDKFYQGDRSHAARGNGLGLSIVKMIVELAGGRISVRSELGRGTVFTVFLPKGGQPGPA